MQKSLRFDNTNQAHSPDTVENASKSRNRYIAHFRLIHILDTILLSNLQ